MLYVGWVVRLGEELEGVGMGSRWYSEVDLSLIFLCNRFSVQAAHVQTVQLGSVLSACSLGKVDGKKKKVEVRQEAEKDLVLVHGKGPLTTHRNAQKATLEPNRTPVCCLASSICGGQVHVAHRPSSQPHPQTTSNYLDHNWKSE